MKRLDGGIPQTFERPAALPALLANEPDELLQRFIDPDMLNCLLDESSYINDGRHEDLHMQQPVFIDHLTHPDDLDAWNANGGNFISNLLMSKDDFRRDGGRFVRKEVPVAYEDVVGLVDSSFEPKHSANGNFAYTPVLRRAIFAAADIVAPILVDLSEQWLELKTQVRESSGQILEGVDLDELPELVQITIIAEGDMEAKQILFERNKEKFCALQYIMSFLVDERDEIVHQSKIDPSIGILRG